MPVTVLFVGPVASACTYGERSTEENFERADAVFVGRVVSTEPLASDWMRATVAVERVLKGTVSSEESVYTRASTMRCGFPLINGSTYALFAAARGGQLRVSVDGGTTDETHRLDELALTPVAVYPPAEPAPPVRDRRAGVIAAGLLVAAVAGAASIATWRRRTRIRLPG